MSQSSQHLYEFGSFRLDPYKRNLSRDGEVVQLTPKCFEILLALLDSRGEVVTKGSLIERVWPDSFVEEGNLTYNISMLRKALGERGGEDQYILTVPGKGYRFTVNVKKVCDEPEEVVEVVRPPTSKPDQAVLRRRVTVIAALVIILGSALFYWLISHSTPTTESNSPAAIKSIAVLPFKLEGAEKGASEIEYLSDGISESLINKLGQLSGLKVTAKSSSFKYKGSDSDPEEVATALGVESILTGKVLQLGERFQVSVELMDASHRTHLWGDVYTPRATDLLAMQSEISEEIARNLRLKLTHAEQQKLARRETPDPEAYQLLLKARFRCNKCTIESMKKSVEYLNQAIAAEPTYASAYAELARVYTLLMRYGVYDPKEYGPKAEAATQKALELDQGLAEAHLALAIRKTDGWQWQEAEREYKRTLELNPNHSDARYWYSVYLSVTGHHEQAILELGRAMELDPLSSGLNASLGQLTLYLARHHDEGIEALRKTLELDQPPNAYEGLGYNYAAKGMFSEAIAAYRQSTNNDSPSTQIYLGAAYAKAGQRREALAILRRLQTGKKYFSPTEMAILYDALGEREQAFASLERGYAAHDLQFQFLGVDPAFDGLRSEPRFQELIRRVGLPQ